MNKDFYETLGVSKTATPQEIKSAYRKLALQWHPDKNKTQEAEKKFKEINEAYEVLSDPKKRQMYDQYGSAAFGQGGFPGGNPFGGFQGGQYGPFNFTYTYKEGENPFGDFSDPFEIFEQFFGFASPFREAQRREHVSVSIDFMDAVKGIEKEVTVGGKKKKIKIPPGVDDGSRIKFPDFFVTINVRPHNTFQRSGNDIFVDIKLPLYEAITGGEIKIPTLDGDTKIRVKPGTQSGSMLRLSGQGMPTLNGGRGDFYIRLYVDIPSVKDLSGKQKKALEELKKV